MTSVHLDPLENIGWAASVHLDAFENIGRAGGGLQEKGTHNTGMEIHF